MSIKIQYQHEKLGRCSWWLERGYHLLPAQVDKKYLLAGWGEFKARINSFESAVRFFDVKAGKLNIAVISPADAITLDFDNAELYASWAGYHPDFAKTYTERTPRGGYHVFLRGTAPRGLVLKQGVELKTVCLVNPSHVEGKNYIAGSGEILEADPEQVFFSLSKPGYKTVRLLNLEKQKPAPVQTADMIGKIKAHWSTVQVFQTYRPDIILKQSGAVLVGRCPFHEDHKPSLFVNPDSGFWKCHACGASGDVINAYARFQNIPNREAVASMARALEVS